MLPSALAARSGKESWVLTLEAAASFPTCRRGRWEIDRTGSACCALGVSWPRLPEVRLCGSGCGVGGQLAVLVEAQHLARKAIAGAVNVVPPDVEQAHDLAWALPGQF